MGVELTDMKIFECARRKDYVSMKCEQYNLSDELLDILPDYVETMMGRKRNIDHMRKELRPVLNNHATEFLDWFFQEEVESFEIEYEKKKRKETKKAVEALK